MKWYKEEYGFFGLFYHCGDHSLTGFDINKKLSRAQRTDREINYISKYLKPKKGDKILDCPCGNGRHSYRLTKMGYSVTGIDLNQSMLDFHKECQKEGKYQKNPKFLKQDMRDLELPNDSFDHIINMFISFGFFESDEDNERVVSEFYRVLKPEGKLLIHLDLNYDNVINRKFNGMEHVSRTCEYQGKKNRLEIDEKYNSKTKRLDGTWTIFNGDKSSKSYSLRVYNNKKEFIPLFEKYGFKNVRLIDPMTGSIPNEKAVETVLIAEKSK